MIKAPLVSIIIPCYNYGHFLADAIESALAQTYTNLECIVIDDGSKDNTEQVARKYAQQDARVKYILQANQGLSAARNKGIAASRGRYILPLDADDKIASSYIEKAVVVLESNPSIGIVYCEAQYFGSINCKMDLPPYSFPEILLGNSIFATALFKKEDWERCGGYRTNMKYGWEDYDLWLSIIELGREVYKIPEVLFYYRQGHNSMLGTTNKHQEALYKQLIVNHPKLYLDNFYFFVAKIKQEELAKASLEKINKSVLYRYLFKPFIKAEIEIRRALGRWFR